MQPAYDATRATDGLYAAGCSLYEDAKYFEASCIFRAMAAAAPEDERGWLGLGLCHEAIGQRAVACQMYRAGEREAASARCAVARTRALRGLGRDDDADEALDLAEQLAADADEDVTRLVRFERRGS